LEQQELILVEGRFVGLLGSGTVNLDVIRLDGQQLIKDQAGLTCSSRVELWNPEPD